MKRTFGIEFEFRDSFYSIVDRTIKSLSLSHPYKCQRIRKNPRQARSKGKYWHLKYDKTVSVKTNNRWTGGELASPALFISEKSFEEIRLCLEAINECKPTYNEQSGLHIHVNINDIDRVKFLAIWGKYEEDIYNLFSDRKNGDYLKPLYRLNDKNLEKDMMDKLSLIFGTNDNLEIFGDKNCVLHFYERGDLNFAEIRICGMTTDVDLLTGWIKIVLQMIERTKEFKDTLSILFYNLPSDILDFVSGKYPCLVLTDSEKASLRERMKSK